MSCNNYILKNSKNCLSLYVAFSFLFYFTQCHTNTVVEECDIIAGQFIEQLLRRDNQNEIYTNQSTYIVKENLVNNLYHQTLLERLDSESLTPKCGNINYFKLFPGKRLISVKDINPDFFNENSIIEFTPLYQNQVSSNYFVGLTYYCGNDCGRISLFELKLNDGKVIIKDEIEIGVM